MDRYGHLQRINEERLSRKKFGMVSPWKDKKGKTSSGKWMPSNNDRKQVSNIVNLVLSNYFPIWPKYFECMLVVRDCLILLKPKLNIYGNKCHQIMAISKSPALWILSYQTPCNFISFNMAEICNWSNTLVQTGF